MLRVFWLPMCMALLIVSGLAVSGCDEKQEDSATFDVGPDNDYPIPGLGLDNQVLIEVRHVGLEPMRGSADEPSIGGLRVVDDTSTLAEDGLMYEGDTLRFNYDNRTFELTVVEFNAESYGLGDPDARATLMVEIL